MGCRQSSKLNFPTQSSLSERSSAAPTPPSIQERQKIKEFINLLRELHRRSNQCGRIQKGSPGAGSLSSAIDSVKSQLIEVNVESILTKYADQFLMTKLKRQYEVFDEVVKATRIHLFLKVLNKQVNEAGNNDGYSSRVKYLEKLNFESGTLKGIMESVLEYWEHVDKDITYGHVPVRKQLTFEPDLSSVPDVLNTYPDRKKLLNLLADINNQWYEIGLALEVPHNDLENLRFSSGSNTVKLNNVIHKWLTYQSISVTWGTVIAAIEGDLIKNKAKADDIRRHLDVLTD